MATETTPGYTPLSMRDLDDSEMPSNAHEPENYVQNPPSLTEAPSVPSIEISPPPSPPTRAQTEDSFISAAAQPLSPSNTRPLESSPAHPSERPPEKRRLSSLTALKERVHGSFTPSLHELLDSTTPDPSTRREYSHKKQRYRLWRLTIGEFLYTLAICLTYFGILYAYAQKNLINVRERRIFNSLITGVSLLLGVNLAASLRSYAKLLRWRMLAICYRPLETFDLVMGCDSLMNVLKLLWKARDSKRRFLPSRTQIICFTWLLVHLAVTVLVGIIGLNYNLDNSDSTYFMRTGNVSIVNLNGISTGNYLYDLAQVQQWGIRGALINPLDFSDPLELIQSYYSDSAGYTLYYFQDQNALDQSQIFISSRWITSQAYCKAYIVNEGQYGNLSYITYDDGKKVVNQSLPAAVGPGGLIAMSEFNSTCGDRCVDMYAFQAATLPADSGNNLDYTIPEATYFVCNNTVPQVGDDRNPDLSSDYMTSDLAGRMLAGALGWSDLPPVFDGRAEYAVYTNSSRISFGGQPIATDMANVISQFTMGAIAFMDSSPFMYRLNVTSDEQPVVAQVLKVKWKFAGAILGVIPFIHFLTLAAVIAWANKAIIKDDSHLAIAKTYHNLLHQLGDRGCLLRGDEIVAVLENPSVAYGWRQSVEDDGAYLLHVDVFERGRVMPREERPFQEGWYNGKSKLSCAEVDSKEELTLRRRYRDFDASDYF